MRKEERGRLEGWNKERGKLEGWNEEGRER